MPAADRVKNRLGGKSLVTADGLDSLPRCTAGSRAEQSDPIRLATPFDVTTPSALAPTTSDGPSNPPTGARVTPCSTSGSSCRRP